MSHCRFELIDRSRGFDQGCAAGFGGAVNPVNHEHIVRENLIDLL